MMAFARAGDTVVVHSMDRLARNLDDLRRIVQALTERGIRIEFVKEHLSFTGEDSPMSNLMLSVMGAFAGIRPRTELKETRKCGPLSFAAYLSWLTGENESIERCILAMYGFAYLGAMVNWLHPQMA